MTENISVADAISGRAKIITTCPPPFVPAGTSHRFDTTATIHFENNAETPVTVDITLKLSLVRPDREVARHDASLEVPPGGPTVHVVNWPTEYTVLAAERTIMVRLTVQRHEGNKEPLVSTWYVCEFTVE